MKKQNHIKPGDGIAAGLLCVYALLILSPVFLTFVFSLQHGFQAYVDFFIWNPAYVRAFIQSMFIALAGSCGTLLVSVPAAYVFAKVPFRGRNLLFYLYIIVMLMPFSVTLLPQYMAARRLGIYNSLLSLILPGMFAPFAAFLLTQMMKSFPDMFIEAARLETDSTLCILIRVVLPSMTGGVICTWALSFAELWNLVAEPMVLLESVEKYPLSVLLSQIRMGDVLGFAASVFYMLLPLCIFAYFSAEILEGLEDYRLK